METYSDVYKGAGPGAASGDGRQNALLCDIGNTAIKIGVASVSGVLTSYSLPTRRGCTADSLGLEIMALLHHSGFGGASFGVCVIASVCPALNEPFRGAIDRYLRCPCLFVPDDLPVPLDNRYERPGEVGADRLVAAWSARQARPGAKSLIVVDFGTAVTFDCVEGCAYLGGLIFPGPATAVTALASSTARLPLVGLELGEEVLRPCRDTATSIRHGLIFGYAALVEGLCARLGKQLPEPVEIVATGGFAADIGRITKVFNIVLPGLLLEGLAWLYFGSRAPQASKQHMQRS